MTNTRNPRYVAVLALVSCLILIGGWLVRPRDIAQSPAPPPTETELDQLARRTERRSLDSMASYFARVAHDVESSIVYIQTAASSAIVLSEGRIITPPPGAGRPAPATITVAALSQTIDGQPTMWGPNLPFEAIAVSPGPAGLTAVRPAVSLPAPGDWLLAVWRSSTASAFAAGNFRQAVSAMCGVTPVSEIVSSLAFTETMAGGGLFNIDGELLAMVLPCQERLAAVTAASILAILNRPETAEQRLQRRYGLAVGASSTEEQSYFGIQNGVLVREVWMGYAGDAAGIRPGDIVTERDGNAVVKIDDLSPAGASPSSPLELTIQRAARRLKVTLADADGVIPTDGADGPGLTMESSPRDYRVQSVRPDSPAALAGIQAGDRLVRIDRAEPRSLSQVTAILGRTRQRPMWLEFTRDGRRMGVLVR